MGYRLNIYKKIPKDNEFILENTKLYGYCNENELKSYHYLISIGKFTGKYEYFGYGHENAVELKNIELKKFIKYYIHDLKKYYEYKENYDSAVKELQNFLKQIKPEETYIIRWE